MRAVVEALVGHSGRVAVETERPLGIVALNTPAVRPRGVRLPIVVALRRDVVDDLDVVRGPSREIEAIEGGLRRKTEALHFLDHFSRSRLADRPILDPSLTEAHTPGLRHEGA